MKCQGVLVLSDPGPHSTRLRTNYQRITNMNSLLYVKKDGSFIEGVTVRLNKKSIFQPPVSKESPILYSDTNWFRFTSHTEVLSCARPKETIGLDRIPWDPRNSDKTRGLSFVLCVGRTLSGTTHRRVDGCKRTTHI